MARSAVWILLLCAIAAGVQAKTLPVAITRRHGQHQAPTPGSAAPVPLQARSADLPVLGAVGNIIGGRYLADRHPQWGLRCYMPLAALATMFSCRPLS